MRVTVCELHNDPDDFAADWERLAAHVRQEGSELVVLPEMAFAPWFGAHRHFDPIVWLTATTAHDAWMACLGDLAPAAVISSRPIDDNQERLNAGYIWQAERDVEFVHAKYYLPDEPGFWEASWYGRGDGDFSLFAHGAAQIGMLICTELWFFDRARAYGQAGAHIIAVPRATPRETLDKWLVGGRAAAIVAGAFVLSSNAITRDNELANLGGRGWVVGPDGDLLAQTSPAQPFATVDIDLAAAERAKQTYPRYVLD